MKSKALQYTVLILVLVFLFIFTIFTRNNNDAHKIYLLYGNNYEIEVKNGYVTKLNDSIMINLGTFTSYSDLGNLKSCTKSLYIDLRGNKKNIFTKTMINNSLLKVTTLNNSPIGSCKVTLSDDEFTDIINNLYFTLEYMDSNGVSHETTIKLNLKNIK